MNNNLLNNPLELTDFEIFLKTDVGRHIIISNLSIKEYFMLGMVNKHTYNLLKMDLYKDMLNDISKIKNNNKHNIKEITKSEMENIPLHPSHKNYDEIKSNSTLPIILITSDSKSNILSTNNRWYYKYDNNVHRLYEYNKKINKITRLNMVSIHGMENIDEKYYKNSIKILNKCVILGIFPKYQYLMIQKHDGVAKIFVTFDKTYDSLPMTLYNSLNNVELFKKIVVAIYDFTYKFTHKMDDDVDRIGDVMYFINNSIVCKINENNINIFKMTLLFDTSEDYYFVKCMNSQYVQPYIEGIGNYITSNLCSKYHPNISMTQANQVIKEYNKIMNELKNKRF